VSEARLYLQIAVWSQVISSIVFMAVLVFMWIKWIMPVVLSAQARSNKQIAEAERRRDEVKGALTALRDQVESATHDAVLIVARAEDHAKHERENTLREATAGGERSVRDAAGALDRARTAARQRLREDLLTRALVLARADATSRVDASMDAKLIERFVGSLEAGARG
jgi:F0F1-type ATP synthase membrane subunit b/b'